jgi:hypothetical protein
MSLDDCYSWRTERNRARNAGYKYVQVCDAPVPYELIRSVFTNLARQTHQDKSQADQRGTGYYMTTPGSKIYILFLIIRQPSYGCLSSRRFSRS